MDQIYEMRCPIHGNIKYNERERQIIDHPFFQRLRHITQLGFANYVFPGATHNRFSHSLGVMHLAGRIWNHLIQTRDQCLKDCFTKEDLDYFSFVLRIAALLHDVGHAPFSHASESILPPKQSLNLPKDWYKQMDPEKRATHEDFSVSIIYALSEESPPLLSQEEAQDICSLIDHSIQVSATFSLRCDLARGNEKNIHPLLKSLISGEIDVDRMDYLHRDSHHVGVHYGKYDMDRLILGMSCHQTEQGIVLVLDHNALYTYENFLLARLHMFLQVYFHKTLLQFDYYLYKVFEENEINLVITGELENFLMVRDDSLMTSLWEAREQTWASRIIFRKTAKRLFQFEHYHPKNLKEELLSFLDRHQIQYFFLQSTGYMSMFSKEAEKQIPPLLLKKTLLEKEIILPVQKASLLLEQYHQNVDLQHLYCEPEDYSRACELLIPFLSSKNIL